MLAVETPAGERYTRDGRLAVDAESRTLVTLTGRPVLGEDGPIVLDEGRPEVREDGAVLVDGIEVGRLKLVEVDPKGLTSEGAGLFAASGPVEPAAEVHLKPGFVEGSNVDPVRATVSLIEALRSFEAIAKANQMLMSDMVENLFNEGGRPLGR
jgi:flagellar basal body rod protein FlgG